MSRDQKTSDQTIIPLSRTKLLLVMAGSMVFVIGGWWMFRAQPGSALEGGPLGHLTLVHAMGLIGIAFFGLVAAFAFRKLFDRSPGLVLREDGIVDNSSGVAAGLIPWRDIVGFDVMVIQQSRMLVIRVVSPEAYIERGNPLKRSLNRMNFKLCGSPLAIASTTLKINFDELVRLCSAYHAKYGAAQGR